VLLALLLLGGCGGEEPAVSGGDGAGELEPGGTVRIAVADPVRDVDPLTADNRAERLASRQIHEPLVSEQTGPFGETDRVAGLARRAGSSAGDTIWTLRLRDGIRFQDGTLLDADAVIANSDRWRAAGLLPEVRAVDSPRPGFVRFQLAAPEPGFPRSLGSGRLGIVSPSGLSRSAPITALSGTGPFELRESSAGLTLLARNSDWWGTRLGLGPGVDQIELAVGSSEGARADSLVGGVAQVADQLGPVSLARVRSDPLLTFERGGGVSIGFERAVRGIDSTRADQSLADVWLTDLR
jgi:peptide/nickel transport system substrate-binding protein